MEGTTQRSGELIETELLPDPDPLWQIVEAELTGQIGAWKMGGYGTIRRRDRLEGQLLTPSEVPDTNWRIVGVADFNADGESDLLWQHQTSGLIAVWYMNGLTGARACFCRPGRFQTRTGRFGQ